MGRLTLNVLLSFAQFEREVTAERIRDKIAASKQKGMWMGVLCAHGIRSTQQEAAGQFQGSRGHSANFHALSGRGLGEAAEREGERIGAGDQGERASQ